LLPANWNADSKRFSFKMRQIKRADDIFNLSLVHTVGDAGERIMHINANVVRPNHLNNVSMAFEHSWVLADGVSNDNVGERSATDRYKNVDKLLVELEGKIIFQLLPDLDVLQFAAVANRELFYHTVSFKFSSEMTKEKLVIYKQHVEKLAKIDGVVSLLHGSNVAERSNGFEYALGFVFTSQEAEAKYQVHDDHQALLTFAKPLYAAINAMDFLATDLIAGGTSASTHGAVFAHFVSFKLVRDLSPAEAATWAKLVDDLRGVPDMLSLAHGLNVNTKRANGMTHGLWTLFRNAEALRKYLAHPLHDSFLAFAKPLFDIVNVVDFPCVGASDVSGRFHF